MVVDTVKSVGIDLVRLMYGNIVIAGGTTLCKGVIFFFFSLFVPHFINNDSYHFITFVTELTSTLSTKFIAGFDWSHRCDVTRQ